MQSATQPARPATEEDGAGDCSFAPQYPTAVIKVSSDGRELLSWTLRHCFRQVVHRLKDRPLGTLHGGCIDKEDPQQLLFALTQHACICSLNLVTGERCFQRLCFSSQFVAG